MSSYLFYVPIMAPYGGMERHVLTLAEEAARRGHHIRFLTTSNSLNAASREKLRVAGIDFRELPAARGSASQFSKLFWLLRQTLAARFARRWDLIYTNGQSALARTVWRAASSPTRILHHHHTAADPEEQRTWSAQFRAVLSNCPEPIACSQATADHIAAALNCRRPPKFLPYFTACPLAREQIAERCPAADAPLQFGFIGRLVATKGIAQLAALSQRPELSGIRWHIYGSGPDFPAEYFQAFPNLAFHGPYRDQAHYAEILQNLDAIALYTQHNEGMPLSLIEAMSAGLPWVASDRGGTRELARSPLNCELINNPHDPAELLHATESLAARIRCGQTSRLAQRAVYDTHFAPEVVSGLWLGYFENPAVYPCAPR